MKLNQFNFNYPKIIQSDKNGYTLATENKQIYSKWRFKGYNNMTTDYEEYDKLLKQKKDKQKLEGKFVSLDIGEDITLIYSGMKQIVAQNPWSHQTEDTWIVYLDYEGHPKEWVLWNMKTYEQFRDNKIQDGDKINISRVPNAKGKSDYIVKKV